MPDKAEDEKKPKKNGHNGNGASEPLGDVPSIPPLPAAGPWRSYKEIVAQLATRIVEAQRPIRVLQAIRWDDVDRGAVPQEPRSASCRRSTPTYYAKQDLGFDPRAKAEEFEAIARDIDRELGEADAIGAHPDDARRSSTATSCACSRRAGRRSFYAYSRKLYGSPKDKFPDGKSHACATSGTCSTRSSRTSTTTLLGPQYARDDHRRRRRRRAERALRGVLRRHRGARRGRRHDPRRRRRRQRLREGPHRRDVLAARHRHPRGARGLGARRDVAQRPGADGRELAREGPAAHDRGAGGARRAAARSSRSARTRAARAASTIASSPSTRPRTARASSTSSSGSAPRATTRRSASTTRAASSAAAWSRAARRSRRTPATARASSSTTRSSAAPSSTTAPTSSRSSSSARSRTRTSPCSRGA